MNETLEVPQPILCSPYEEPAKHWIVYRDRPPELAEGRRKASYHWRDPKAPPLPGGKPAPPFTIELKLVNLLRERVKAWREAGYPGSSRTTQELLQWWRREGRQQRLFFAQLEAAETILFLVEARADLRQGIDVPADDPEPQSDVRGFIRYALKLATGTGKTTVMGMLAAWSILNKVNDRANAAFSDVVLVVCPSVTIRHRLQELLPDQGEASLYRTRDIVPAHLMPLLARGRVVVTNWHVFEPQVLQTGGVSARVSRAGVLRERVETVNIGAKTTTARGSRYFTLAAFEALLAKGELDLLERIEDESGRLVKAKVRTRQYVESDRAVVERVLGREVGSPRNILVLNDEAHHAYRIRRQPDDDQAELDLDEEDEEQEFVREATVWVDGLDRIDNLDRKRRGINFCVDLSATPYFLASTGREANRPFPWVVSDFGLVDAIESGLVKIPQLAVRDSSGQEVPGYFNIWEWILPKLTPAERGGRRGTPKPEAVLKYAHHPIAMLAGLWEEKLCESQADPQDTRPPVFILVCKNTKLADVVHKWLAEGVTPAGIPPSRIEGFRNRDGALWTIRVDTRVVHETDTGSAKSDEEAWMRHTLDTVGRLAWPADRQGRPVFPEGFEALAKKLGRPLHPPGRDVRCIVSVGMLTEGWDCTTVSHIVGLRPFMSQLLCEQVVGRGLRRRTYETGPDGLLSEQLAQVLGVPFEVVPFKANPQGGAVAAAIRNHVHALAEKKRFELTFPRVEGYTQAIRNRVDVDWKNVGLLFLEPGRIPPEVELKALHDTKDGRLCLNGPGRIDDVSLAQFRAGHRVQELAFDVAAAVARVYAGRPGCSVPVQALFPQVFAIVERYLREKVVVQPPADRKDLFLAPYYGWLVERLVEAIRPAQGQSEAPEVPRYETSRGPGSSADVDFWTSRDVREVQHSHVNFVVADTKAWEQSAAFRLDRHRDVDAFVKNAGLGFGIPYLHNGRMHDYLPDFVVRLDAPGRPHLILETKGYDPLESVKREAAERWVAAVNADGTHGRWAYRVAKSVGEIDSILDSAAAAA